MSTPFLVYVVACRPYAEKVAGCCGDCDGTFHLSEEGAKTQAERLNYRDGLSSWKVYPALLLIEKPAEPRRSFQGARVD